MGQQISLQFNNWLEDHHIAKFNHNMTRGARLNDKG